MFEILLSLLVKLEIRITVRFIILNRIVFFSNMQFNIDGD